MQIDQDINNSGDYVIYSSIQGVKSTHLNLQPQIGAGNVRIGYDPNNYGQGGKTEPPAAKLAVRGKINASDGFVVGNSPKKIFFPGYSGGKCLSKNNLGNGTTRGSHSVTCDHPDVGQFNFINTGNISGEHISFNKDDKDQCLYANGQSNSAILDAKQCDWSDPSQKFVRSGSNIYNPYSFQCLNADSSRGFWECKFENEQNNYLK